MTVLHHHELTGETGEALTRLELPGELVTRWQRIALPLNRSVVVARDGDAVVGAVLSVWRTLGRYVKIADLWTADGTAEAVGDQHRTELERQLLDRAERYAWDRGAVVVKRELAGDAAAAVADGAAAQVTDADAVAIPGMAGPPPQGVPSVPSGAFRWLHPRAATTVPYVRQTSNFTCGPSCLLMALGAFGLIPQPDRATEFALWREATMVQACDPYGLALAAVRHGLAAQLTVTTDAFLLLEEFEETSEREVRCYLQSQFRQALPAAGVDARIRAFDAGDIAGVLDSGRLAIVLIDEDPFDQGSCPHWIIVHGRAGESFLVHDPWTGTDAGESWLDGYDLPLSGEGLERLCAYGDPAYSALLAVGAR